MESIKNELSLIPTSVKIGLLLFLIALTSLALLLFTSTNLLISKNEIDFEDIKNCKDYDMKCLVDELNKQKKIGSLRKIGSYFLNFVVYLFIVIVLMVTYNASYPNVKLTNLINKLKSKGVITDEDERIDYTKRLDSEGQKINPFKDWENTTYLGKIFKSISM